MAIEKDKNVKTVKSYEERIQLLEEELLESKLEVAQGKTDLEMSERDLLSYEETIHRMKEQEREDARMRLASEKHLADLMANQRMQDLKLKKYSQIASENEDQATTYRKLHQ